MVNLHPATEKGDSDDSKPKIQESKTNMPSTKNVNKKQRCHSPLLSLISDMKNEKSDSSSDEKDNKTAPGGEEPLLTFQASWMDNNLFEELEDMRGTIGVSPFSTRRPPLMSFDSVNSSAGETET